MKAVLLGAGYGTRLRGLTARLPKILVPVAGEPLLGRQLRYLAACGMREVRVNTHHHAERVREFLRQSDFPLDVSLSFEDELLGTAGALLPMREFLSESFVLLYGDVVTNADLAALLEQHKRSRSFATIAYYDSETGAGKGVMKIRDQHVAGFVEKPAKYHGRLHINAGIYALDPEILDFVRPGADFGNDVWPSVLASRREILAFDLNGAYVRDVGTQQELERAESDILSGELRW